jgi:hypothetical protein
MGLLDALRGRTKQVQPNLDALFALPSATITFETQLDLVPSGQAGLCFKAGSGESSINSEQELRELLELDEGDTTVQLLDDTLGFKWLVIRDEDFSNLVTRIHGANTTLVEHGLGPRLLCAVFGFIPKQPPGVGDLRVVYLMKQGTFYPFAPRGEPQRDNELELRVRSFLADDLPIEPELTRWMALWGLPVS